MQYRAEAGKDVWQTVNIKVRTLINGSTDKSSEILAHYAANDARIEIISQENQGVGAARNKGMCHAKTEWVFVMDVDDVIFPNRIERPLEFIRRHPDINPLVWSEKNLIKKAL